jgi:hypothetical protein
MHIFVQSVKYGWKRNVKIKNVSSVKIGRINLQKMIYEIPDSTDVNFALINNILTHMYRNVVAPCEIGLTFKHLTCLKTHVKLTRPGAQNLITRLECLSDKDCSLFNVPLRRGTMVSYIMGVGRTNNHLFTIEESTKIDTLPEGRILADI